MLELALLLLVLLRQPAGQVVMNCWWTVLIVMCDFWA